ncbi:DinB family protein [Fulvivirga sp. RKSG066]|uniref:DinB family protein n=1 Tax=Fulvivirga aurantia TaxID=2529383 RepID=UPI0012BD3EB0|nr:DinB family protein [Fulvivirga aurantia]MTI21428.1 DinB family protein [Fulvivirga aurantia]
MKKTIVTLALVLVGSALIAQDQFKNEAINNMSYTKGRIAQLAEAMPDDKFAWSPAEGVRSFSGIIGHAIAANYFFGMKLGATVPEGFNPMTIEKELTSKADLMEALNKSHEFVTAAIKSLKEEDMSVKVEMPFPGDFTKMSLVNIVMNHSSEHMGQMIAYARMNGVTPPWSMQPGEE